jgi:cell division protein FtsB
LPHIRALIPQSPVPFLIPSPAHAVNALDSARAATSNRKTQGAFVSHPRPFRRVSAFRARLQAIAACLYAGRRRFATAAAALLAVGVGYHVLLGHNGLIAYQQKRQDERALQVQLRLLRDENDRLQGHVGLLQTDPDVIEHQAREDLHYTRPGEVIYTLPLDPPAPATH